MADYKVAVGHDVALISLVKIDPEPTGDPVAPVQRQYSASGKIHEDAEFLRLHWDHIDSPTEYLALLTLFGLHDSHQEEVTIYCRDPRLVWTRYNGLAILPEVGVDAKWSNFFLRDVDMYIVDLQGLA